VKTVVEHGGQILGHAAHAAGTYGFDSGLFDCFEHGARLLAARRQLPMHCRVVAGKPQRDRIGVTANDRRFASIEPTRRLRQTRLAAGKSRPLRGKTDFEIIFSGDCAQANAYRALKRLGRRLFARAFGFDVRRHGSRRHGSSYGSSSLAS
jgi:hypothetical protein